MDSECASVKSSLIWLICCTWCFLDVNVGLSVLFTDENYNAPYEDTSSFATKILQDKIRKNVSDPFKEHFPKINCFSHDKKPISV